MFLESVNYSRSKLLTVSYLFVYVTPVFRLHIFGNYIFFKFYFIVCFFLLDFIVKIQLVILDWVLWVCFLSSFEYLFSDEIEVYFDIQWCKLLDWMFSEYFSCWFFQSIFTGYILVLLMWRIGCKSWWRTLLVHTTFSTTEQAIFVCFRYFLVYANYIALMGVTLWFFLN